MNLVSCCVDIVLTRAYADYELFGVDELVVEDGVEDGGAELSCRAGEGYHLHSTIFQV